MSVNDGVLNSSVSFSQIQSFYGGSNPISLSEYYRGGAEVPSTSLSGANPYVNPTSFSSSGGGSGGAQGISVSVANNSFTTPGSETSTNIRLTTGSSRLIFTVDSGTRSSTSVGFFDNNGNPQVNGVQVTSGSRRTFNNGARIQVDFRGATGAIEYLRYGQSPDVVTERRTFTFTNNTGQNINLTATGNGVAANNSNLSRGASTTTGIVNGASEGWNFNYSYNDAGSGSGSADATVAGIFADVQARQVTTTNPNASTAALVGSGQSVSAVDIPAGDVDFTLSATPRSDGNLNVLFQTGQIDRSGLTLTPSPSVPFRVGDGTPASGLGPNRSGYFAFNFGLGNVFTLRVTGNIPVARRWGGFAGNIGGAPAHANGVITLTNNSQSTTSTVQDIFFTNNTGESVILSPSSTGASGSTRTMNNGQRDQVQTGGTSTNWSFQYRYAPSTQPANTAIPQSGTINTNQFNSPGNAAS